MSRRTTGSGPKINIVKSGVLTNLSLFKPCPKMGPGIIGTGTSVTGKIVDGSMFALVV